MLELVEVDETIKNTGRRDMENWKVLNKKVEKIAIDELLALITNRFNTKQGAILNGFKHTGGIGGSAYTHKSNATDFILEYEEICSKLKEILEIQDKWNNKNYINIRYGKRCNELYLHTVKEE